MDSESPGHDTVRERENCGSLGFAHETLSHFRLGVASVGFGPALHVIDRQNPIAQKYGIM